MRHTHREFATDNNRNCVKYYFRTFSGKSKNNRDIKGVQIYLSHSGLEDEEVEETYGKIEEIIEKEKKGACVILLSD